jgi:homoserine dehydrogenase
VNSINIFCFGFGQVAKSFLNKIKSENLKINLSTTSTGETCQKSINGVNKKKLILLHCIH